MTTVPARPLWLRPLGHRRLGASLLVGGLVLLSPSLASAGVQEAEVGPTGRPGVASSGPEDDGSAATAPVEPGGAALSRVEDVDAPLKAALTALGRDRSAERHCRVAERYLALGIADKAFDHYTAATEHDPGLSVAWDARARIWRDWGMGGLGLGDAYRAVHHAPESAPRHNTLGTVLQAVGNLPAAREAYVRAVQLDPYAWYAWNNLCQLTPRMDGRAADVSSCLVARSLAPDSSAVRNNLAIAYAVAGNTTQAIAVLASIDDEASRQYNIGVVYAAARRLPEALDAFEEALALRPSDRRARVHAETLRSVIESQDRPPES